MSSIEQTARLTATMQRERAQAAQRRMRWGARWMSSFRGEGAEQARLKPEHLARGEMFYRSTHCWV